MRRKRVAGLLAGGALALCACAGPELLSELGLPSQPSGAMLEELTQHGAYLAATLQLDDGQRLRFLFPADDTCRSVLRVPGRVDYVRVGKVGEVVRGASHCQANGIASLEAWRDRTARPLAAALPAGGESRFAVFYVDERVMLLRGSFPQAARIGWRPSKDAVAMVPASQPCAEVANEGAAVMKFHGAGFPAFSLSGSRSHCAILALAEPLS